MPEVDDARRREAAHQQLGGPLVEVWDNLTTPASAALAEIIAARRWLTVSRRPPYTHELNPGEPVGSPLQRSLANRTQHPNAELTARAKTRPTRRQYRPGLLAGFLASTGLKFRPFLQPPPLMIFRGVG